MFLTFADNEPGAVGIAWFRSVCESDITHRTSVIEYFNTDVATAQIVAQEIGLNLGMKHDFIGDPSVVHSALMHQCLFLFVFTNMLQMLI